MDFFEHQERARRNSLLLIVYFVAAVIGVVVAVNLAALGILALLESRTESPVRLWVPELFAAVTVSTLAVISIGSMFKLWQVSGGGESVALALGGKEVPPNTTNLGERVLLNVVEEMALASGTPVPPVYVMEEEGINAFAAGNSPQNAVIGVTRGAIKTLSRDELQGVIAHEFSHILNGDVKLNMRLMGWLHGILVIALIGSFILRFLPHSGSSSRSSSSSSSGKKENGMLVAIAISGFALMIIGYIGVFFAQMIKAAVSRQREFLADSSAVQFTRNPSGISGALKKIGGWADHANIQSPQAQEASHMFFGSALTSNLFATHPPLTERVRRIEPNFTGEFPTTVAVRHSLSEIVDPKSLSNRLQGFQAAHAAAVEGAERLADHPNELVESVGEPREQHIAHVHGLVDELDAPLAEDVRNPLGAVAVIYSLLLTSDSGSVRDSQVDLLQKSVDRRVLQEMKRIYELVQCLAPEQRLPVACLALPSLHQLSLPQLLEFQTTVDGLVRADRKISLFEFAVQRYISKRLVPRLKGEQAKRAGNLDVHEFQGAITITLSILANFGSPADPVTAFEAGRQTLPRTLQHIQHLPVSECKLSQLDQALDSMAKASPAARKVMLASFSACIAVDRRMSVEEAELLRVISDALGCPVPPIL